MHRILFLIISLLILTVSGVSAAGQEPQVVVPYTLADRDRVISLEAKVDLGFSNHQRQLDDLKTLFYWGFGIMLTLFLFMFGYMVWDRRTAMKPALAQSSRALEGNTNLLKVLRDYSKKHPDLAEILRSHGIL
jgi:hypothetical protein